MGQQWFVFKNGQQLGPYTWEALRQQMASNALQPTDLVWTNGMDRWAAAREVQGLCPPNPVRSVPSKKNNSTPLLLIGVLVLVVGLGGLGWWGLPLLLGTRADEDDPNLAGATDESITEDVDAAMDELIPDTVDENIEDTLEEPGEESTHQETHPQSPEGLVKDALDWYLTDLLKSEAFYLLSYHTLVQDPDMTMSALQAEYGDKPLFVYYYESSDPPAMEVEIEQLFSEPPYAFGLILEWDDVEKEWVPTRYIAYD